MQAPEARRALRRQHPKEFDAGTRDGFTLELDGAREPGGYPYGFRTWDADRRHAYFAGYNFGRIRRRASNSGGAK